MFKLEIELGNEAMMTAGDVAEAVATAAVRIGQVQCGRDRFAYTVHDRNGNSVGGWTLELPATGDDPDADSQEEIDATRAEMESKLR